ncbi:MAG: DUF2071 domain-containing protein [Verrucomicrobiota bacterium]
MFADKNKFRPVFRVDWRRVVFLNFAFDADLLSGEVAYPLDLYEGRAMISLVAFETTDIWFDALGKWTRGFVNPFGRHLFLNVRTYVDVRLSRGIYFMKEFVNRPIAIPLARAMYDLPYAFANVDYHCDRRGKRVFGKVGTEGAFRFEGQWEGEASAADKGGLAEFLVERYEAFLGKDGCLRRFRIEHEPWEVFNFKLRLLDLGIVAEAFPWFEAAEFVGAYFAEGLAGVGIGGREEFGRD